MEIKISLNSHLCGPTLGTTREPDSGVTTVVAKGEFTMHILILRLLLGVSQPEIKFTCSVRCGNKKENTCELFEGSAYVLDHLTPCVPHSGTMEP